MLCRDECNIVTKVYGEVTNADVYFNWNAFAPHTWERGTLKAKDLLDTELKHLEKVFVEKNNYSKWVIRQVFTQVKFDNDSNLSPPTIEAIEVPANENGSSKEAYVASTLSRI